jgi:hypothetical protein
MSPRELACQWLENRPHTGSRGAILTDDIVARYVDADDLQR